MSTKTLDTTFFSLPRPGHLLKDEKSPNGVVLHFEHSGFKGTIKIHTHVLSPGQDTYDDHENPGSDWHYLRQNHPRAHKNDDFEEFFRHCIMFPNDEYDAENIPVQTGDIEDHLTIGAYQMTPEGNFRYVIAIDLDPYHYITFVSAYEKIDGEISPDENGHPPAHEQQALTEVYNYLLVIINSLHVKADAVRKDSLGIDENFAEKEQTIDRRMQLHASRYTTAEEQAADPFHARHYPDLFKHLQDTLAKHPDLLPYEQGILSNARLTIGFKANALDDYSEKGNTRFFGLPDLPPNVEYPKVDPKSKENKGNFWKFIAQINFSELKGMCEYLPERGIAYFFIESQYDELSHVEGNRFQKSLYRHKVFYYDGDPGDLISAKELDIKPEYIHDVDAGYEHEDGAQPARAEIFPCVCVMNYEDLEYDENGNELYPNYPPLIMDEEQYVPIRQFNYALLEGKGYFHGAINGSVQDLYHGSPYTQAANTLGGNPEDYVLLLQVEGNSEYSGYGFGDADTLYFVIHKEKLKNLDFSQVYCTLTWWWAEFGGYYE